MRRLAIIPARGGSKRIPRKNIKLFLGKPIIYYPIKKAFDSSLFDEVMVSTEDNEISQIAKNFGASVPFKRSKRNANDHATTVDVIEEVIENYEKRGEYFDQVCCIYPTAPLLKINYLLKALDLLIEKGYTTVLPVVKFSYPIFRSLKIEKDGKVKMNWPEFENTRSQDLPYIYHDAGQFYWLKTKSFIEEKSLISSHTGAIELSETEVQDIDTMEDWRLAELKMELISKNP